MSDGSTCPGLAVPLYTLPKARKTSSSEEDDSEGSPGILKGLRRRDALGGENHQWKRHSHVASTVSSQLPSLSISHIARTLVEFDAVSPPGKEGRRDGHHL